MSCSLFDVGFATTKKNLLGQELAEKYLRLALDHRGAENG